MLTKTMWRKSLRLGAVLLLLPRPVKAATVPSGNEESFFYDIPFVNITAILNEKATKASGIVSVVTSDDIKRMGARHLSDVFDSLPGVESAVTTSGDRPPQFRGVGGGGRTAQVKFLINGVHVNDLQGGSGFLINNYLMLDDVERIEIIRGPGSALYGENALVGVINIITRTADTFQGLKVSGGSGSFDTRSSSLEFGRKSGPFGAYVALAGQDSKGYRAFIPRDSRYGNVDSGAPGTAPNEYRHWQGQLVLSYNAWVFNYRRQASDHEQFTGGRGTVINRTGTYMGGTNYASDYDLVSLKGTVNAGDWSFTPQAGFFYLHAPAYLVTRNASGAFTGGRQAVPSFDNARLFVGVNAHYTGISRNELLAGVSYDHIYQYRVIQSTNFDPISQAILNGGRIIDITNQYPWNKTGRRFIGAAFVQDKVSLASNLDVTVGARYDNYNDIGNTFNPRASAVWSPTDRLDVKLLYGKAFRAPNFRELYNANNSTSTGNSKLAPETIRTYELGTYYRYGTGHSTGLNVFHNDIRDLIDLVSAGGTSQQFMNALNREYYGVEWENRLGITRSLRAEASYSFLDGHNKDGSRIPYLLHHKATAALHWMPSDGWDVNVSGLHQSSKKRANPDPILASLPPRSRVPEFTIVNAAVVWEVKNTEFSVSAHNLFNVRYHYQDAGGGLYGDVPRSGRDLMAKVSWKI